MLTRLVASVIACTLAACGDSASDSPAPETGWDTVRNPVLAFDDAAVKDAFAIQRNGTWHLGYSTIREDPFRFRLGFSTTRDFRTFENAPPLDQPEVGGLASPTVAVAPDGRYVMTYNSHQHDVGETSNKLYYRTSDDLATWSEAHRFHVEGADADNDRLIDAALAFTDAGAFLFFKREQTAVVAHSASGALDGPWKLLGAISPADVENLQVLRIDGTWHLLATSLPVVHRPVLHRLAGDPSDPLAWRTWTRVRELEIPEQAWNTGEGFGYERANAGYLVDDRAANGDGFFYLVYAGSTELATYENRGHAKLGLARSRDLTVWEPARSP